MSEPIDEMTLQNVEVSLCTVCILLLIIYMYTMSRLYKASYYISYYVHIYFLYYTRYILYCIYYTVYTILTHTHTHTHVSYSRIPV